MKLKVGIAVVILAIATTSVVRAQAIVPTAAEEQRVLLLLLPARQLAHQGRYEEAIVAARRARGQVGAVFGDPGHWAAAYALDDLARFKYLAQDVEGSFQASRDALAIATRAFGVGDRASGFAETSRNISYSAGHCDLAFESAGIAFDGYLASRGPDHPDTQRAAMSFINLISERGDLPGALNVYERGFSAAPNKTPVPALLLRARLAIKASQLLDANSWLEHANRLLERSPDLEDKFGPAYLLRAAELDYAKSDLAAAERRLDALLDIPELPQEHRSEWLAGLQLKALIQGLKGRFAEAEAGYIQAFDELSKTHSNASPPIFLLNQNLGWVYRMLGDYTRAETRFRQALSAADSCYGSGNIIALQVLLERTRLYLDMGRLNEASIDAERAVRDSQLVTLKGELYRSYAFYARALVFRSLGQLNKARDDMLAAVELIRSVRGMESWDLAPAYAELADIALGRREINQARDWAQRALDIAEQSGAGSMWATGRPLAQLLEVAAAQKEWNTVGPYGDRIIRIVESRLGASQARSEVIVRELKQSRGLIETTLDGLAEVPMSKLPGAAGLERAFAAMQLPHMTELTMSLRLSDQDVGGSVAAIKLLGERRELLEQVQAIQAQLQAGRSRVNSPVGSEASTRLADRSIQLEIALARNDNLLRESAPEIAELLRPSLERLSDLQALLAPDEALYVQVVSGSRTHGVLLRSNDAWYRSSSLGRAVVRRNVSRLRRALDLSLPLARRLPFDYRAARDLYAGSVGLFEAELAGVSDITVVLDDAFQNLPSAVLVASEEGTGRTTFLGESFGIAVEPSVGTFKLLRTRASRQTASKPFVGFGDPILLGTSKDDSRSANSLAGLAAGASFDDLQQLPALPETAKELRQIAKQLSADSADLFMQSDATEATVKRLVLSDYRVVSFATHGLLAGQFRGLAQPALVLTPPKVATPADDGLLTASEIAALKLNADLVVLSACNTGRTDQGGGAAGLSALARGFFFAGADSIIVSHWAVSSEATVALISEVLRLMSSDSTLSKPQAMRRAMVSMMEGRAGEQFKNPAYWAPFVLLGDSRPLGR